MPLKSCALLSRAGTLPAGLQKPHSTASQGQQGLLPPAQPRWSSRWPCSAPSSVARALSARFSDASSPILYLCMPCAHARVTAQPLGTCPVRARMQACGTHQPASTAASHACSCPAHAPVVLISQVCTPCAGMHAGRVKRCDLQAPPVIHCTARSSCEGAGLTLPAAPSLHACCRRSCTSTCTGRVPRRTCSCASSCSAFCARRRCTSASRRKAPFSARNASSASLPLHANLSRNRSHGV